MSHDIETMFYTRTAPSHGLGNRVDHALSSKDALTAAQWKVIHKPIKTEDELVIPNYKANIRETDQRVLGLLQIATPLFKIMTPSNLQMNYLESVFAMKPQEVYRTEERYGS